MAFVTFSNITSQSGINDWGESWGTAFGDFNNDGWVDIWLNNHRGPQRLYLNQRDGSFSDISRQVLNPFIREDNHGALWADFDNDGDQDLLQLNGGGGGQGSIPNFFYTNDEGQLIDRAAEFNLDYPLGRGRMPLLFDYNHDGRLDALIGVADRPDQQAPPALFQQASDGGPFVNVSAAVGLAQKDGVVGQISHLSGSRHPELILLGQKRIVYSTKESVWSDVTADLNLNQLRTSDFAIADLNNDLRPDIFQVTDRIKSTFFRDTPRRFKLFARSSQQTQFEQGIDFRTQGSLSIELPALKTNEIFLGSQGINPEADQYRRQTLRVMRTDPSLAGLKPRSAQDFGIYIGYDPQRDLWMIRWSNSTGQDIFSRIKSSTPIQAIYPININSRNSLSQDNLFINTPTGFIRDRNAGITVPTAGKSVVAADFDNDMDLDLYIVSATKVGNPSNVFYQNLGDGTFKQVGGGAGAKGTKNGVGGAAATADINNDGFLDLLVTNGGAFLGNSQSILEDGPTELFLNQRNGNRWIALNLEGRFSNRDGIGAQVFATAGGITQLREQNGGIQSQVQNHRRIHFGLAKHRQVDSIEVKWSSGLTQTLFNLAARQILKITEGIGHVGQDLIHGLDQSEFLAGRKGSDEIHGAGGNDTLSGDEGKDTLFGGKGNDVLLGGRGNDSLVGGIGRDQLVGGKGHDWLIGGNGRDFLDGGIGKDTFQLNGPNKGLTLIKDFNAMDDRIVIQRQTYFEDLPIGTLPPALFTLGSRASTSEHRLIYNPNQGELRFDPDGIESGQPILVAKLLNKANLKSSQLTII